MNPFFEHTTKKYEKMKCKLCLLLVLTGLFTGLYFMADGSVLPGFSGQKTLLEWVAFSFTLFSLIYMVSLYRREQRQVSETMVRLRLKNSFLELAIHGSDPYVWDFRNGEFVFEHAVGNVPLRFKLGEMWVRIHPDDLPGFKERESHLWEADKEILQFRARFTEAMKYEWWELRFSSLPGEGPEGERRNEVSGLLVNIHAMKSREEELIRAKGQAQTFLANMSHEVRTPLNAIVGFSNLLTTDRELEEDERQMFTKTINESCDMLLGLVNDVLEISRIDSGQMRFHKEVCPVVELVESVYLMHRMLVPANVRFLEERAEGAPIYIWGDRKRLMQVMTNFLTNACKFTKQGYIKLGFERMEETDEVGIFVEDTGIGLSEEQQEKVFGRFYKQDEFAQGAGLGLSICQGIVRGLGGRIELSSKQGEGSRFSVVLPVYRGGRI